MVQANELPDYALTLEDDQVVFWRRAGDGTSPYKPNPAATAPAAIEAQCSSTERRIVLSEWAIERLREFAPGWDKHMLEHAYIAWAKDKEEARNEDARFLGWVKSYTKNKAAPYTNGPKS